MLASAPPRYRSPPYGSRVALKHNKKLRRDCCHESEIMHSCPYPALRYNSHIILRVCYNLFYILTTVPVGQSICLITPCQSSEWTIIIMKMVSVTAPRHTKVRSTMQLYLAAVSICDLCRYCIDTEILCARARDLLSFDRSSMSGGSSMCAGPCVDTCVDTI